MAPLPREVMDVLPGAISRVMSSYRRSSSPTTTTTEPPVIWFPNQSEECEQVSEESLLLSLYLGGPSLWCLCAFRVFGSYVLMFFGTYASLMIFVCVCVCARVNLFCVSAWLVCVRFYKVMFIRKA